MTSHADRYGLLAPVSFTIALFSADGQIGSSILNTLGSSKRKAFQVVAFIPPGAVSYISHPIPTKKNIRETQHTAGQNPEGVTAVVFTLNGAATREAHATTQAAAADANLPRSHQARTGCMHHIYLKPSDPTRYTHPV